MQSWSVQSFSSPRLLIDYFYQLEHRLSMIHFLFARFYVILREFYNSAQKV